LARPSLLRLVAQERPETLDLLRRLFEGLETPRLSIGDVG